jgi:hypothetical protein
MIFLNTQALLIDIYRLKQRPYSQVRLEELLIKVHTLRKELWEMGCTYLTPWEG